MRGRQRLVKPEIHSDADLWDAEIETGLPLFRAFVGLWNFSDREGRFEWKPRQLKALILPFWDGDFTRVLDALGTRRFIVRYASGDGVFGLVRTFHKHQSINGRESPSELPTPPKNVDKIPYVPDALLTRAAHVEHAPSTLQDGSGTASVGSGTGTATPGSCAPAPVAPAMPEGSDTEDAPDYTSGGWYQTFRDTFAAEASSMGFKSPPEPMPSQLRSGAKRAGAYAKATGIPFAQACVELSRSALEAQRATGKDAGLHLLSIEPGRPLPLRQTGLRPARASPSPGTTGKDFEDEEDESVQIARLQRGAK